jgi:cytochrome P450
MDDLVFDPTDINTRDDPYPTYAALRERAPVYYNPRLDFWAISRYDDALAILRDWRTFTGKYGVDLDDTSNQFGAGVPPLGLFLGYDPPRHDEVRRLFQATFLPSGLQRFEPMIRRICDDLILKFIDRGKADLANEFAVPFPDLVMAELLGFPREQHARLSHLLRTALLRDLAKLPPPFIPPESLKAGADLKNALKDIVMERRGLGPRDDLIGKLVAARIEGEPLPDEEIVGVVFFLFTAGTEEVTGLITSALLLLAANPDQRARLIQKPSEIPAAVEEILRFDTPVSHHVWTTTKEVVLHGQVIPKGARVMVPYASANRDEREFHDSERFDVTRKRPRILSFGAGLHRCLGEHLARLEARMALERLLPRMPDYTVAGAYEWSQRVNFRGVRSLPLTWTPPR